MGDLNHDVIGSSWCGGACGGGSKKKKQEGRGARHSEEREDAPCAVCVCVLLMPVLPDLIYKCHEYGVELVFCGLLESEEDGGGLSEEGGGERVAVTKSSEGRHLYDISIASVCMHVCVWCMVWCF